MAPVWAVVAFCRAARLPPAGRAAPLLLPPPPPPCGSNNIWTLLLLSSFFQPEIDDSHEIRRHLPPTVTASHFHDCSLSKGGSTYFLHPPTPPTLSHASFTNNSKIFWSGPEKSIDGVCAETTANNLDLQLRFPSQKSRIKNYVVVVVVVHTLWTDLVCFDPSKLEVGVKITFYPHDNKQSLFRLVRHHLVRALFKKERLDQSEELGGWYGNSTCLSPLRSWGVKWVTFGIDVTQGDDTPRQVKVESGQWRTE